MCTHGPVAPSGWPVSFAGANFFSSPVLYDIDGDGIWDNVHFCGYDSSNDGDCNNSFSRGLSDSPC